MSFAGFWNKVAHLFAKLAVWAADNPAIVQTVVDAAKKV